VNPLIVAMLLSASGTGAGASSPAPESFPPGQLGETIRLGRALFDETRTHPLTKEFVGNALHCASCHRDSGAAPNGSTLIGAATAYPAWAPREKAVITLEDRVLNCFMRSLNGTRPANGSRAAVAITAYLTWLSRGAPIAMNPRAPSGPRSFEKLWVDDPRSVDLERGRAVYVSRCASCHGKDGDGDPPVWGPRSYNAGSGMADAAKLAGWVRVSMPPGDTTLTEAEAIDVAAYIEAQPRPDFRLADHLPRDATYNATVRDEVVRAPTWPPRR
jgi:thiosulfate dehydrogenase